MDSLAEQIIIDIIVNEMSIDASRDIWIRNQNRKIPNDNGLYFAVGMVDSQFVSSTSKIEEVGADQREYNEVQLLENIQVDVISSGSDALIRRWEVIAAINSIYSQQKQEENNFRIFRQPSSFVNTSAAEGGSTLNRFSLSFPCFVWYRKYKTLATDGERYFDTFGARVDDKNTIGEVDGLIEFEIDDGTVI